MSLWVTALVTAFAALLGAWAGAETALRRFRKERAFDARKQWYVDAVELLHEAARKISTALRVHTGGQQIPETLKGVEEINQAAVDSINRVSDHLHVGLLLADQESLGALQGAISKVGMRSDLAAGDPAERWPVIIKAYQLTADTIARQGRKHLRLEKLPDAYRTTDPEAALPRETFRAALRHAKDERADG